MYSLNQVIEGLEAGLSFSFEDDDSMMTVNPDEGGYFHHNVVGETEGQAWGGTATLSLQTLNNGRWPQEGWLLAS